MAYAKFRSDNMSGTTLGKDLVAVKYRVSGADTAIENGHFVVVGDYISGEQDVRVATTPTASTALSKIAVIGAPEVDKTASYNTADEFINAAGVAARAYRLVTNDQFAVTADALDAQATIEVGNIVELQASTKAKVVKTATSGSTTIGRVIDVEDEFVVIEVA